MTSDEQRKADAVMYLTPSEFERARNALRFIEEHGETVKVALAEAADAAEGGLFPSHADRFDAAHAALAALRKP